MTPSKIAPAHKDGFSRSADSGAPLSESLLVLKSPKDGLQVYALTFADERAPKWYFNNIMMPFPYERQHKQHSKPMGVKSGAGRRRSARLHAVKIRACASEDITPVN